MPIILGAPRSGTTLLRLMLDAHRELAIPPETGFLSADTSSLLSPDAFLDLITHFPADAPAWEDFGVSRTALEEASRSWPVFDVAEGFRAFYRLYAKDRGKVRWGDKTPRYAFHIPRIAALLPEAHFIHLIRDGRDVACSWRDTWFAPGRDLAVLAAHWCEWVTRARQDAAASCAHYLEVRYETLVSDPEGELRRICSFVGLSFDAGMLRYFERATERLVEHRERRRIDGSVLVSHEERLRQQWRTSQPPDRKRVFAWRIELSRAERREVEAVAGSLLAELGYEAEHGPYDVRD